MSIEHNSNLIGIENQEPIQETTALAPLHYTEQSLLLPHEQAYIQHSEEQAAQFEHTRQSVRAVMAEFGITPTDKPMRPELITPELQAVYSRYPALQPLVEEAFPVLDTMYRGGGLTAYWHQGNQESEEPWTAENAGLEQRETIAEHTMDVMRQIADTFTRYPELAEAIDPIEVFTDALFHDVQEMAGGDLSRSLQFYNHPPFGDYLTQVGRSDLALHMKRGDVHTMTNGLKPEYDGLWEAYQTHYEQMQGEFGQRLLGAIQDPETAKRVAEGNHRFEERKKFLNDTVAWAARGADIKQEIAGMVRGESGDISLYNMPRYTRDGKQMAVPSLEELQVRSIDLTTWRYLQPAVALFGALQGNERAQHAVHCNVIEDLAQLAEMQSAGTETTTPHAERIQRAFDYWNRMAWEIQNGSGHTEQSGDGQETVVPHNAAYFIKQLPGRPWMQQAA